MKAIFSTIILLCTVTMVFAQEEQLRKGPKNNAPGRDYKKGPGKIINGAKSIYVLENNGTKSIFFDTGESISLNDGEQTFDLTPKNEKFNAALNQGAQLMAKQSQNGIALFGLPVKGSTVKGGKNPGAGHKIIPSTNGGYLIEQNGPGNYKMEIDMRASGGQIFIIDYQIDENNNIILQPSTNFKGAGSPKASGF